MRNSNNGFVDFRKDNVPHIYELIDLFKKNKKIIVFKSREEADILGK